MTMIQAVGLLPEPRITWMAETGLTTTKAEKATTTKATTTKATTTKAMTEKATMTKVAMTVVMSDS